MSWFPSSELPSNRFSMSPNPGFLDTPPSPERPQQQQQRHQQDEFTGNTIQHGLPIVQGHSWETHGPRGLGLITHPITTAPTYVGQPTNMPFSWPSEFALSQPPTAHPQQLRKDSWSSESCNPLSTLLPGALWDHLQPSALSTAAYDTSPGRSEYSTSSRPSAVSSPYAHSDVFVRRIDSPQVKIENSQDQAVPQIHFQPQYEQALLVNPEDLMVQPPTSVEERIKTYLGSSSSSDIGDFKPSTERQDRRRAYSSEDILEDRRKRGYTRPDNANCSCKTCGKLFQRSYNLKAHMETHDPDRSHPHTCEYEGCEKRFVRRTDLLRHEQSVSLCGFVYIDYADGF